MNQAEQKQQILIIHGGDSFVSYDEYLTNLRDTELDYTRLLPSKKWRDTIVESFPNTDVLMPTMPNSSNAQFDEWVIWFEKILPFLGNDVRLIGHSLGAMFLASYLHQNQLEQPVKQLILMAGGYDDEAHNYGSFKVTSATGLEQSADEIYLLHSRDDFVVPFSELAKFSTDLPKATVYEFDDRGHFLDADFPELIEILKKK